MKCRSKLQKSGSMGTKMHVHRRRQLRLGEDVNPGMRARRNGDGVYVIVILAQRHNIL